MGHAAGRSERLLQPLDLDPALLQLQVVHVAFEHQLRCTGLQLQAALLEFHLLELLRRQGGRMPARRRCVLRQRHSRS